MASNGASIKSIIAACGLFLQNKNMIFSYDSNIIEWLQYIKKDIVIHHLGDLFIASLSAIIQIIIICNKRIGISPPPLLPIEVCFNGN